MGTVVGKDATNDATAPTMSQDGRNMSRSWEYHCRRAHHAGSWYEDDVVRLRSSLQTFLQEAQKHNRDSSTLAVSSTNVLRAMICPHAGYSYSGLTAAYCYNELLQELSCRSNITQIVVLHPSHHEYLRGQCAVSGAATIETPLGDLLVDNELRDEILELSSSSANQRKYSFSIMTKSQDEHEHSGEMQYPFIAHVFQKARDARLKLDESESKPITVTPIMCGSLSTSDEMAFGALLNPILRRPNVLTIVSTDFCHWGRRFSFQPVADETTVRSTSATTSEIPIYEFIEQLDRRGMEIIELQQPGAFASYLKKTGNTICGRHAIGVWLCSIVSTDVGSIDVIQSTDIANEDNATETKKCQGLTVQFIKYAQSSKAQSMSDSSVSYGAAIATATNRTSIA
jgi:MEMO1 family protein